MKAPNQNPSALTQIHPKLDELGLDPYEFRIYANLASHADSQSKPWAGITTVAVACRMRRSVAVQAVRHLERRGLIRVLHKPGSTDIQLSLSNPPPSRPRP